MFTRIFRFFIKISIFDRKFKFFTEIRFFYRKFRFFTEIRIFVRQFKFLPKFAFFSENLDFFTEIRIFEEVLEFLLTVAFDESNNYFFSLIAALVSLIRLVYFSAPLFLRVQKYSSNKKHNLAYSGCGRVNPTRTMYINLEVVIETLKIPICRNTVCLVRH